MLVAPEKTKMKSQECSKTDSPHLINQPSTYIVSSHKRPPLQCKLVPVKLGQNRALSTCEKFKLATVFHAKSSQLPRQSTLV